MPGSAEFAELTCAECGGILKVDTVSWHTGAWCLTDISPLLDSGLVRGGDLDVPFADGSTPLRRRPTSTPVRLTVWFGGLEDENGNAHANPKAGLFVNMERFETLFVDPPGTTAGTRTAELTLDNGTVLSGPFHVERMVPQLRPGTLAQAIVFCSVPSGKLP